MATAANVPPPPPFPANVDPSKLATTWAKWKEGFDIYITAAGFTDAE